MSSFLDKIGLQKIVIEVKQVLDSYLGKLAKKDEVEETDLDDNLKEKINSVSESNHSHTNKKILDGITQEKINKWDRVSGDIAGETIVIEDTEIGESDCSVTASMIFQKLSTTTGNLHISYHINSNNRNSSNDVFLSRIAIENAFTDINFNWTFSPYQTRVIFAHQFINNPSDTLEIIGACNSEYEMGETGIKVGFDSNGRHLCLTPKSNSSLTLNNPVYQEGSYGHIDIFGIKYVNN